MFCFAICDCNENKKSYDLQAVKTGHTKSCGCSKFNNPLIMEDLTGKFFGRLKVIARDIVRDKNKNTKSGNAHWLCQCSCGNRDLVSVGMIDYEKNLSEFIPQKRIRHINIKTIQKKFKIILLDFGMKK